jgi:hypothetical protein
MQDSNAGLGQPLGIALALSSSDELRDEMGGAGSALEAVPDEVRGQEAECERISCHRGCASE